MPANRLEARLHREEVLEEIRAERRRQDDKWGGPQHDDRHGPYEWVAFIKEHADKALWTLGSYTPLTSESEFRQRMVEVAALAVAAIETYDRQHQAGQQQGGQPGMATEETAMPAVLVNALNKAAAIELVRLSHVGLTVEEAQYVLRDAGELASQRGATVIDAEDIIAAQKEQTEAPWGDDGDGNI